MSKALENQRQSRLRWVAMLLGEPPENVTLAKTVEPVEPDFHRCGGGRGSECCIFMTAGSDGLECERNGPAHGFIIKTATNPVNEWTSKRQPTEPYPSCMKFPPKGDENDG